MGKDNKDLRFIDNNKPINELRLIILQSIALVIENGMKIMGVSTPKSM